ncbi:DUF1269 domain-containing protein [Pseudonocardia adelaidensis]|uniref:DUF1269 domain-containing protein n=1 Tax=Pseudonocardia adelaidensis TaxID=648754 RepID=A0ABP9NBV0_9PSEU
MLTLTGWEPETRHGADEALKKVNKLHDEALLRLHDAVVVSRSAGQKKPKTHELLGTTGTGAVSGGFWGMLFGLLFPTRLLGMAIGAAGGAPFDSMRDLGITDDGSREVRDDARA